MISCRTGVLGEAIRWARRYMPVKLVFRAKSRIIDNEGDECNGLLVQHKGYMEINILKDLDEGKAIDTLMHELAHAIDIRRRGWGKDHYKQHSDSWGQEYSRIYRDFWEMIGQKKKGSK